MVYKVSRDDTVSQDCKRSMILRQDEIKLIERLRQVHRQSRDVIVIVHLGECLSWRVAERKEF